MSEIILPVGDYEIAAKGVGEWRVESQGGSVSTCRDCETWVA